MTTVAYVLQDIRRLGVLRPVDVIYKGCHGSRLCVGFVRFCTQLALAFMTVGPDPQPLLVRPSANKVHIVYRNMAYYWALAPMVACRSYWLMYETRPGISIGGQSLDRPCL